MPKKFKPISLNDFYNNAKETKIFLTNITDIIENKHWLNEYVFSIKTWNKSIFIIVFSSILINTKLWRKIWEDSVKIVYKWETKEGILYRKIAHLQRVEGFFKNFNDTINNYLLKFWDNINDTKFNKHCFQFIKENDLSSLLVKQDNKY